MDVKEITVKTDQEVKVYGTERMVLEDTKTRLAIALAERTGGHTWTVTAPGGDPVTTTDRGSALDAMNAIALAGGVADGYSVLEPNFEISGGIIPLRQLDDYIANQGSPE